MTQFQTRRQKRLARIAASALAFQSQLFDLLAIEKPSERMAGAARLLPRRGHRLILARQRKHEERLLSAAKMGNRAQRRAHVQQMRFA